MTDEPVDGTHPDEDEIVALALGHVEGPGRADLATHLLTCTSCRRDYDEVAAAADEVLLVTTEVQPPVGFEARVLARMSGAPQGSRPRRTWVAAAVAAAAVLLVALGVGALWVTRSNGDGNDVATLARPNGGDVGTVTLGRLGSEDVMVVTLADAPRDVTYTCRITWADGTTTDVGPWTTGGDHDAWAVSLPDDVADVALVVERTGEVWSEAHFEAHFDA